MQAPIEEKYNDKNYPIEPIWALKSTLVSLLVIPILTIIILVVAFGPFGNNSTAFSKIGSYAMYPVFYYIFIPFHFFANILRRATYHFQFEEKYLNLKQGIFNKQNRQLPYGVIQNVLVTRGILDIMFGLATLTIQNATQSDFKDLKAQATNQAGFFGNSIQIPGLTNEHAEEVKNALLKKIKESPIVELGM